jgi:hypothetical protein
MPAWSCPTSRQPDGHADAASITAAVRAGTAPIMVAGLGRFRVTDGAQLAATGDGPVRVRAEVGAVVKVQRSATNFLLRLVGEDATGQEGEEQPTASLTLLRLAK